MDSPIQYPPSSSLYFKEFKMEEISCHYSVKAAETTQHEVSVGVVILGITSDQIPFSFELLEY